MQLDRDTVMSTNAANQFTGRAIEFQLLGGTMMDSTSDAGPQPFAPVGFEPTNTLVELVAAEPVKPMRRITV